MSDTSVIPTPASPDVCSISVLIDGTEISGEFHVLSASVSNELNRIPAASVQLRDGEASKQTFAASDTDHFVPGKEIEIKLGYRGETETVFKGIIVKHRVRVRKNGTFLSLECRDKAVRMTSGLKSRYYTDTTDGDILDELIGEYDLDRDVATTKPSLKEVVQYDSTDWDFVVCRAEANGHVVAVRDGKVTVGPPATDAEPVVTAQFGATVLELDAEIDARWQVKGVTAKAWNATDQELVSADASEPSVTDSGNLSPSELSDVIGGDPHLLRHGGKLGEPELQAWADGRLLKDRLAKVRGRVRFQGFGGVTAGDVIEVTGIGERFAGKQYVAGVRHTFANGNWETDVAFGLAPETYAATYPVTAQPAGGLLPAVQRACRSASSPRSRTTPTARTGSRSGFRSSATPRRACGPASPRSTPATSGARSSAPRSTTRWSSASSTATRASRSCSASATAAPSRRPSRPQDDNHVKGYESRSKMKLTFDDDKKVVVLETPAATSSPCPRTRRPCRSWTRTATRSRSTTAGSPSRAPRT